MHLVRPLSVLAVVIGLLAPAAAVAQNQLPINMIVDCHCDPFNTNAPMAVKQATYDTWIANLNWLLDQCDTYGPQISFLSTGWWMEFAAAGGANGPGAAVLRRIYDTGGQIGSHQHNEFQAGPFSWPNLAPGASLLQIQSSWNDVVSRVNSAITTAYSGTPPESLAAINCVRGAHVPSNGNDFQTLMQAFGFQIKQGGEEGDYFGWYGHHLWNPYRVSASNNMDEDLGSPFLVSPQGSLIGTAGIHHGVFQDMTVPMAKRQFLQLYVNWRYRDRYALPQKPWSWGWGGHPSDYDPTDPARAAAVDMFAWLNQHFTNLVEPTGSTAMVWSTQRQSAAQYLAWEAAHPATSSFPGHSLAVNWGEYPYLRAVAEEMIGFGWIADLSVGAGIEAYHLRKGTTDAVVLWRPTGTSTVDLSAWAGPTARVVGLETGLLYGLASTAVTVGQEPLIVTEEATSVSVAGTPSLGSTITVNLSGVTGVPGQIYGALAPAAINVPHIGFLLIDPSASLTLLASGTVGPNGLSTSLTIPNDPLLVGISGWFQGVTFAFSNASLRLSINAPSVTIF